MWIPVLICTHWLICSGDPIEGRPQATYEECKAVIDLAVELFGDDEFTRKYVISKCEKRG